MIPSLLRLFSAICLSLSLCSCLSLTSSAKMPDTCSQAIIGLTDGWDSTQVTLCLVEKNSQGQWVQTLGPYSGRLGRSGLVWGLGLNPIPRGASTKVEGDGRSPAGIFNIGDLYLSMGQNIARSPQLKTIMVTPADLWVTDAARPDLYNRHLRLNRPASTDWEKKEMMRQNDHAHSIKLEICHNRPDVAGRPIYGRGSSIFFHLWRNGGQSTTAGCTSMDEEVLKTFVSRLKPSKRPVYILLPRSEYKKYRQAWQLP